MDTLKHCFITIVFICLCSQMSNVASMTPTPPQVDYGANCTDITDCITSSAICNGSGICACNDTHYYYTANDTCTQKQAFGAACSDTSQCDTSDSNIGCIDTTGLSDKKCLCKDGWYRPNTSPTSCVATTDLKPSITDQPSIGTGTIGISWTNTNVTGGYTYSYTVMWSPGSPGSASTEEKIFTIPSLSPGTEYTVNVTYTITLHGRSQTIPSDPKTFKTEQIFEGVCSDMTQCDNSDSNIDCIQITVPTDKRCLCKDMMYKPTPPSSPCTDTSSLKPVFENTPSIGTGNIGISWKNADVTGRYSYSFTVMWSPVPPGSPGTASTQQKNYNIQSLSPGTEYTVNVTHTITLHGRSQTITSDPRTFTTNKQAFAGSCSETSQCDTSDSNIECIETTGPPDKKCLCKSGWYRPNTSPTSCVEVSALQPVITDPPSIGTGNIYISWTNTDVTGGYTYSYTVMWSPGSPGSPGSSGTASTQQKTHNIQPLSQGTEYTVTVAHTITQYGRSQSITSVQRTFTTRKAFGAACSNTSQCDTSDSNIGCIDTTGPLDKKCLCKTGWYRPNTTPTSCVETSLLRPVIRDQPSIGIGNTGISWTNTDVTGGYSYIYTVVWSPGPPGSPGSSGTASTQQKNYNIQPLSQGTEYTVTVAHTVTQYDRSQTITSVQRNITTKIAYNQTCSQPGLCFDARTNCYSGRCRCDQGYYRATDCSSIEQLRPTSVTADVHNTTTMTASWAAPSNAVITGYEVSVIPGDITPISVGRDIRTTPIIGLTPGRQYTVSVKTKITYLQGRDEKTIAVLAAPKRTPPAAIVGLDSKTNRTAPDITIVFAKADGDADKYIVTLSGRGGDTYYQTHEPLHGSGQDFISVVFTGVVPAVLYNLTIQTQSGTLLSSPYTLVIRVQGHPAGKVTNLKSIDNTSRSVAVEWSRPLNPNGDIYEYIVDVRTGSFSKCVKRVIINCTERIRTTIVPQMQIECATYMTVVISRVDIESTSHVIQHNITGLNPDTPYSIDVVAVNEDGPGTSELVNLHTPEEAAGEPTNIKAQSTSSSEITLTWDPPQPRPGVTRYNVTVYEKQEEGEGYDTLQIILIPDWATKMYTIGNLSSYWFYKFDIVAETVIGASAIVSSSPEGTMESEPTAATNFRITNLHNEFNRVRVSWKCPKQKNGRNGVIVNASLIFFTIQPARYVEPVRNNTNFSAVGTDCMWDETVTVTTEFMYEFQIRLYNRGFVGAVVKTSIYIQGGPPLQTEIINSVKRGTEQSETPPLLICPRCLHDRTNGQVNKTGLIVCRKDNCGQDRNLRQTTSAVDYDNMANWNAANAQDFGIPYRATRDNWLDGLSGKSSLLFTLGNDDCSGNTKNLFCNGKLPTGETFIVYAFSCTNNGCTTSNRIEISTSAPVPVAPVVGGVVAAVVVILVVIGIFIILRRKKAQRERPKKNRNQVIAKFHPDQNDTYDEIPDAQMVTVNSSRSNEGYVNYVSGQSSRDTDNTYDQLATYQNADGHDYGRITTETRFK